MMGKTDIHISVKQNDEYLLYVESVANRNNPRVYQDENNVVVEIMVRDYDYEIKIKDGVVIITAKERER